MVFVTDPSVHLTIYGQAESGAAWTPESVFDAGFAQDLEVSGGLLILDAMSFPWEALAPLLDRVIVYVVTPAILSGEELIATFADIFSRLSFFDRFYFTREDHVALAKARNYHGGQWRVFSQGECAETLAASDFASRSNAPEATLLSRGDRSPAEYWAARGAAVGTESPELVVGSLRHCLARNKIMHGEQMQVLRPVMAELKPARDGWRIVEFGCGIGRVLSEARQLGAEVGGVDLSPELLAVCMRNLPGATCAQGDLSEPLPVEANSADIALFVTVLHHLSWDGKLQALRSAIKGLRVSGHLVLLEDFVANMQEPNPITMPASVVELQDLVARAGAGCMVFESIQSFRYEHVMGTRTAVVVLRKVFR